MTQKGEHTWDLVVDYRRCPECGFINEDRQIFRNEMGSWIKEVVCSRCEHPFTITDKRKHFRIGASESPEITWE